MNKLYSILIITFLTFSKVNAQKQITMWDGEVYRNMCISLKDGSVLNGYGKVILIEFDDFISFKRSKEEGETLYGFENVVHLKTKVGNSERLFEYKTLTASPSGEWLKLIETVILGKVTLYQGYFDATSTDKKRTYYISNKGDDFVKSLKSGDTYSYSITKTILKYTRSCSALTSKLKSKHFNRYGIKDIIAYYNNNCSIKK